MTVFFHNVTVSLVPALLAFLITTPALAQAQEADEFFIKPYWLSSGTLHLESYRIFFSRSQFTDTYFHVHGLDKNKHQGIFYSTAAARNDYNECKYNIFGSLSFLKSQGYANFEIEGCDRSVEKLRSTGPSAQDNVLLRGVRAVEQGVSKAYDSISGQPGPIRNNTYNLLESQIRFLWKNESPYLFLEARWYLPDYFAKINSEGYIVETFPLSCQRSERNNYILVNGPKVPGSKDYLYRCQHKASGTTIEFFIN